MKKLSNAALILTAATLLLTACRKTGDNTANYEAALNAYFAAHPSCLWPQPVRFPVQVDTSNTLQTGPYDALFDAGLLVRTTDEKKVLIVASRQVTNYDLSDKGRSSWTADPNNPGYGNFCYGHRAVQTIIDATPNNGQPGATTKVNYLYSFTGVPDWAQAIETQTEFHKLATEVTGHGGSSAVLSDTTNGWQVQVPATPKTVNPDATIVQ
jgi:hypothetical protein